MRDAIVAEALSWIDTPFAWGQSQKGRGCDCKGLVAGVARNVGLSEGSSEFARFVGYGEKADSRHLTRGLAALFDRAKEMRPGDVLQLRIGGKPQHIAIYAGEGRMIHTARGLGRVRTVPLGRGPNSWAGAVHQVWTWRGIE